MSKAPEPRIKVDAAIAHHVDMVLGNARLDQVLDHGLGVDMRHAAVRVADDHHFLHAQLHDAHQEAPHGAVKRGR